MIRRARYGDMEEILRVYEKARRYMCDHGNPSQWAGGYPARALLEVDICREQLYVDETGDGIHGVFALIFGDDPTYAEIEQGAWLDEIPYATIHRVAGDGEARGVFRRCLDFCRGQSGSLRIDTHRDNLIMQRLIEKNGFIRCGIIHVEDGSPRIAYQHTAALGGPGDGDKP